MVTLSVDSDKGYGDSEMLKVKRETFFRYHMNFGHELESGWSQVIQHKSCMYLIMAI